MAKEKQQRARKTGNKLQKKEDGRGLDKHKGIQTQTAPRKADSNCTRHAWLEPIRSWGQTTSAELQEINTTWKEATSQSQNWSGRSTVQTSSVESKGEQRHPATGVSLLSAVTQVCVNNLSTRSVWIHAARLPSSYKSNQLRRWVEKHLHTGELGAPLFVMRCVGMKKDSSTENHHFIIKF